ncbi:MAG TPA: hypothetical protein VFM51_12155 [Solirubrobacterales bacterium]|nr:hypothetical protein [Solirubrobacterales bacterium]
MKIVGRGRAVSLLGIAVIAILAALNGCGDSEDSSPMSKAEFEQQAVLVCYNWEQEQEERLEAALEKYQGVKVTPEKREAAAAKVVLPPMERAITELMELDPPTAERQEIQNIIRTMEEAVDKLQADPSLVSGGNPLVEVRNRFKNYGLTQCII